MHAGIILLTTAIVLAAGCTVPMDEELGAIDMPQASPTPPAKGACQLLVSGLMPPGGPPSLQGNDCHFDDVASGNLSKASRAVVNVTWDGLQPALTGRVQAAIEYEGCTAANKCSLARGGASRQGPILLEVLSQDLRAHAGQDLTVRVYPDGYSFQQPVHVAVLVEWPSE